MKIGILGGSFDPIHQGHLTLARESARQFKLDKILFIPAALSPHKREESQLIPAPMRAEMVRLAIEGEPTWELLDIELKRSGVSYTVDTLREIRKIYPPPHELFFIAGADSFRELESWKEPEEILKLAEWIVAPRPSFELPERLPPGFYLLEMTPLAVSATELRRKIVAGEEITAWVPKKVEKYLERMKVYERKAQ
jgi:nicotinate-nucleotide adenylyltransferase